MSMSINTNLMSMEAQRNLDASQLSLRTSMQRLSSGLRINSAADDAAGLGISQRMTAQVNGGTVAIRNANDGISLSQTADSALSSVGNDLQRMRELAVQARNSTNTTADKSSLNQEFQLLGKEVQRVLAGTTFNGKSILGADAGSMTFQIGANTSSNDTIAIKTTNMTTAASISVVTGSGASLVTLAGASRTNPTTAASDATGIALVIDNIDVAINTINNTRASFGATENRFTSVISNLQSSVENQAAARSRIRDADFATETANLSRSQVLQSAGTAMVAQANQSPQQVLKLLQ